MNKQEFESIPNHLPIDWEAEQKKCIESPYYFFTNYCTVNGEKCTTHLSEDEFNKQAKQIVPENLKEFVENTREYMKISQPDLYIKESKELKEGVGTSDISGHDVKTAGEINHVLTKEETPLMRPAFVNLKTGEGGFMNKNGTTEPFKKSALSNPDNFNSKVVYSEPIFPPLSSIIDDFISFKFFLNKYKGKLEVVQQKILGADKKELFNSKEVGIIDTVEGKYFGISRPSGYMTVEFGKPSDWNFYQTDFVLRATRRNGGELIVTIQRK